MSLLHSFYCWGQVAVVLGTSLLLERIGHVFWQVLPVVWALVPLANLVTFLRVPLPPTVPDEHRTTVTTLFKSPTFAMTMVLMFCAGAAELTMSQWSSLFAERGLGLPKLWGDLAGPCLFALLMGIGRFGYGLAGEAVPLVPALVAGGALAMVCYLTAALSSHALLGLAGCALCGLAVSLLWPGAFSLAAARFPRGGAAMFAILAVMGDAGASAGPWLAGAVADASSGGLHAGLLIGTVFPLGVVVTSVTYGVAARRRVEGRPRPW